MTSQMLSGPDLGAGYLHQLTTDRDGDRTTFTYHAQDGGEDANGPPKGPLDAFGFVHPPSPCQFGGPRCWHRRFLLPMTETGRVRQCYNRNRFVLETMLDQQFAAATVAIEPTVAELVARLTAASGPGADDWFFSGSTAAWLLGAPIAPRDVDLFVTRAGVDPVGVALADYLIEPTATTDWPGLGIVRGARAFVGTFAAGARVEWASPLETPHAIDAWGATPDGPRMVNASFRGRTLRVPRPEYTLARAAWKARSEVVRPLAAWNREYGVDRELLEALLVRYGVDPPQRDLARAAVG